MSDRDMTRTVQIEEDRKDIRNNWGVIVSSEKPRSLSFVLLYLRFIRQK